MVIFSIFCQTLANMENYHLLLSENGQADSSPQLQILCDDLKCNHRSSTEQLNEIAMFYLTSRGIPRNVASRLLIEAYVSNFLESITQDKIKQFYQKNIFAFINSIYQEIKYERQF